MFAKLKGLFRGKKPEAAPEKAGRKLTAAERREIRKVIESARGNGKPHSAQDTLPFRQMYRTGCAGWMIRPGAAALSLRM